jgi:hypothetical protein
MNRNVLHCFLFFLYASIAACASSQKEQLSIDEIRERHTQALGGHDKTTKVMAERVGFYYPHYPQVLVRPTDGIIACVYEGFKLFLNFGYSFYSFSNLLQFC